MTSIQLVQVQNEDQSACDQAANTKRATRSNFFLLIDLIMTTETMFEFLALAWVKSGMSRNLIINFPLRLPGNVI